MDVAAIKTQPDANQRDAADPGACVWVSASAGTGKTRVLIDRLKRLLLAGVRPERILCLTFTNAAAVEMQNRLNEDLKRWVAMGQDELAEELEALTGQIPGNEIPALARRLFTVTLETDGGLKIYTIHGFCERLLHRFPLEAGIASNFTVVDEAQAWELKQRAADEVLSRAASAPDALLGQALAELITRAAEQTFRDLLGKTLRRPLQGPNRAGVEGGDAFAWLRDALGIAGGRDGDAVAREMGHVLDDEAVERAAELLSQGSKTDQVKAQAFARIKAASDRGDRIAGFKEAFLTQDGAPFAHMATKAVAAQDPVFIARLLSAQDRFHRLSLEDMALVVLAANEALATLLDAIARAYHDAKAAEAALDYDDLIAETANMLNRSAFAPWVLYKLDGGIDHILVDEAQDTSALQWQVIDALAGEFFAGEGASETNRTIFAVGDEKQSIYRFQGAEPEQFATAGRRFEKFARAAKRDWRRVPLNLSFRSTPPVLAAVDRVFKRDEAANGLSWGGEPVIHHAWRTRQAGLVEIWPTAVAEKGEATAPFAPLEDDSGVPNAAQALANRIADQIKSWEKKKTLLPSQGRPIEPGDVLILVRKRHPFAAQMIRALKDRSIPVAGADRMRLTGQLAVMDLMAFGQVMLMPNDDLSLACVLKSPLIGLNDDDLFALAYRRAGSLWNRLRAKAGENRRYGTAVELLAGGLARADYLSPYEFFSSLLEDDYGAGRRALIGRIGPDAADSIDEFLNAALAYDATDPPALQGFLHWMTRADVEIKRDMEQGRNEVRIMTVHGAKGLEANIVFLPDTCTTPQTGDAVTILPLGDRTTDAEGAGNGEPRRIWVPPGGGLVPQIAAAKESLLALETQEYHRLLYVAMTRARDRLYICGFEDARGRRRGCWYDLIADGLDGTLHEATDDCGKSVWRMESAQGPELDRRPSIIPLRDVSHARPQWASRPTLVEPIKVFAVTPSAVLVRLEGEGEERLAPQSPLPPGALADQSLLLRGKLIHAMLEHLPHLDPGQWERAARGFIEANGQALHARARDRCVRETLDLLRDEAFAELFAPGSMAEVPLAARLTGPDGKGVIEVSGQIDRLVVRDREILIADYKTNRLPPERSRDVAPAYLAQLATYRLALAQAFPGRRIACALIWTAAPRLMAISSRLLDSYDARIEASLRAALDAPQPGT